MQYTASVACDPLGEDIMKKNAARRTKVDRESTRKMWMLHDL